MAISAIVSTCLSDDILQKPQGGRRGEGEMLFLVKDDPCFNGNFYVYCKRKKEIGDGALRRGLGGGGGGVLWEQSIQLTCLPQIK